MHSSMVALIKADNYYKKKGWCAVRTISYAGFIDSVAKFEILVISHHGGVH